ncbi:tRNA-specific 2-thiouridylase [Bacteroides faecichinchillae]|uniref:tRNA-specific 2-thiouridylase MnmA n=2 Tax=Bacteroides faecichinchillae TaxID=871325 RepID=A0A1M5A0N3_9BACE|nr:tRNA-specific 2-thiouridylase [Bacteroides faecichinchillae]
MEHNKSIAVLLSGGVDSSVVVHLLCEQGFKPELFYIKIGMDGVEYMDCSAEEDIELATTTARKYGLSLQIVDLHREYWKSVATYAIDKIRKGLTPNPDVMCNKLIKFGCFEQRVGKDFDFTATGHYATTVQRDGKVWLGTAKDIVKDQTDFLAQIDYLQVSKLMFPLGGLMKKEVREIAQKAGLPSAKRKDSQGICFLGKINYNDFVRRFMGEKEGAIIELETGKKLGTHYGYWFYTIGQRKGLGLSGGPWFVIKKDIQDNVIYVSHGYGVETQYGNEFRMGDFHFITDNPWNLAEKEIEITFKVRHTPEFTQGKLIQEDDGLLRVLSSEKIQGIAPGQFGTIYDTKSEICIGSGEIKCCYPNFRITKFIPTSLLSQSKKRMSCKTDYYT